MSNMKEANQFLLHSNKMLSIERVLDGTNVSSNHLNQYHRNHHPHHQYWKYRTSVIISSIQLYILSLIVIHLVVVSSLSDPSISRSSLSSQFHNGSSSSPSSFPSLSPFPTTILSNRSTINRRQIDDIGLEHKDILDLESIDSSGSMQPANNEQPFG
ncbi:hypothetical protein RDWZM_008383 [Blomia tropicalis]|uniref:Transmembrane protein n=1 Tax=Blomia tropicalis TaxID=40697 RepID=A0A9Q0RLD1_BLOTA|nr:hypothetical protein RDWZM_008383 [Blomia tropicalis]